MVTAGVPIRRPEVTNGERGSFGTEFLLAVIKALLRAASASLPVYGLSDRSISIMWLSVPPETILYPRFCNTPAMARALMTTWVW
ncbi:hypothetical protein D9M71_812240 [compost metagenome]